MNRMIFKSIQRAHIILRRSCS